MTARRLTDFDLIGRAAMALASRVRKGGVIINEHVLSRDEARRHVEALGRWFDLVGADEFVARLYRPRSRPFCLLTFDDGHLNNAAVVAPELLRLGAPACFLVTTGFVGSKDVLWFSLYARLRRAAGADLPAGLRPEVVKKLPHDVLVQRLRRACVRRGVPLEPSGPDDAAMSWDDVRRLARAGFGIGAHGVRHTILTRETRQTAYREISESIARVESETGARCAGFAFPNGNYTAELAQFALSCGAPAVFTTEPTWADDACPPWRLPRVQLFPEQTAGRVQLKVAVSAAGCWLSSGDGTGRIYRLINRMARRGAPAPAPAS